MEINKSKKKKKIQIFDRTEIKIKNFQLYNFPFENSQMGNIKFFHIRINGINDEH